MKPDIIHRAPSLRYAHNEEGRHATWLELFYDLVIVAAVGQVGHLLYNTKSFSDFFIFVILFFPVWWIWVAHMVYAARYDTDDLLYRVLTFLSMLGVVAMAVEAHNAAHGHMAIFLSGYLLARFSWITMMVRTYISDQKSRPLLKDYRFGFIPGTIILAISIFLPAPFNIWALCISFFVEFIGTLFIFNAKKYTQDMVRISPEHVPERLGLFTIIVLGEAILSVVSNMGDQKWDFNAVLIGVFGFVVAVSIWWIYFRHVDRLIGRVDIGNGKSYIRSHFPLHMGITIFGVGIGIAIKQSSADHLSAITVIFIYGGFAFWLYAGMILHFVTYPLEAMVAKWRYILSLPVLVSMGYFSLLLSPIWPIGLLAIMTSIIMVIDERQLYQTERCQKLSKKNDVSSEMACRLVKEG